mmetsp:Transcript_115146/g.199808  ORF Transcript_115146/g.199808 Transcript_115146/m.199808 type:complete len:235 (+) Transcript_115146:1422-2126(+)
MCASSTSAASSTTTISGRSSLRRTWYFDTAVVVMPTTDISRKSASFRSRSSAARCSALRSRKCASSGISSLASWCTWSSILRYASRRRGIAIDQNSSSFQSSPCSKEILAGKSSSYGSHAFLSSRKKSIGFFFSCSPKTSTSSARSCRILSASSSPWSSYANSSHVPLSSALICSRPFLFALSEPLLRRGFTIFSRSCTSSHAFIISSHCSSSRSSGSSGKLARTFLLSPRYSR